jgi:hypothetical protein
MILLLKDFEYIKVDSPKQFMKELKILFQMLY